MANRFGTDILILSQDPKSAAAFYVEQPGFKITDDNPDMIGLYDDHINTLHRARSGAGAVLEVTVGDGEEAKKRLVKKVL